MLLKSQTERCVRGFRLNSALGYVGLSQGQLRCRAGQIKCCAQSGRCSMPFMPSPTSVNAWGFSTSPALNAQSSPPSARALCCECFHPTPLNTGRAVFFSVTLLYAIFFKEKKNGKHCRHIVFTVIMVIYWLR